MPPAKRSTSTRARSRTTAFKPPAALANFNKSIDSAEKALTQLSKHAGRGVSQGARDRYKDLKKAVTAARRDSGRFATAIQKDLEQAQKALTPSRTARSSRSSAAKSTRSTAAKSTRSTAAKTTRRAAAKTTRSTTRRTGRAAAKRSS